MTTLRKIVGAAFGVAAFIREPETALHYLGVFLAVIVLLFSFSVIVQKCGEGACDE
jgi:hypothetical protein